jgi:hypothetical protein
MAHDDARLETWRGNWRMEWVASKRHMTAEHRLARAVQTLQADAHSSPASSRLNWRPRRFKWTRPLRRKTRSGFCACAITFQAQSTPRRAGLAVTTVVNPREQSFIFEAVLWNVQPAYYTSSNGYVPVKIHRVEVQLFLVRVSKYFWSCSQWFELCINSTLGWLWT